jgi:predicted peptidase
MNKHVWKKFNKVWIGAAVFLIACENGNNEEEDSQPPMDEQIETEEESLSLTEENTILVTEVEEYGEVVKGIAIEVANEFHQELNPEDFVVEMGWEDDVIERTVTNVSYTSQLGEGGEDQGNYLYLELDSTQEGSETFEYIEEGGYNERRDLVYYIGQDEEEKIQVGNEYQDLIGNFQHAVFEGESGQELDYYFFEPDTQEEEIPLILFLHGNGERGPGNQMNLLGNEGAVVWARKEQQERFPAYVLAPQAAIEGEEEYIWADEPRNTTVKELLDETIENYSVDEDRVYIVGISQGAIGTWRLLEKHSDVFAAAVPIAGTTNHRELNEENLAAVDTEFLDEYFSIPVWAFHAADDFVIPPDNIRELSQLANQQGVEHFHYTEYEAETIEPMGHFSWVPALQDEEMIEWLFEQSR